MVIIGIGDGQITDKYLRGVVVDEVINGYHYDWPAKEKNLTFHHDHLNSVTAVTGHDGTTVETASYGPFGAMESETGPALNGGEVANKLRYTGREFDRETGLYYYRARYYDPELGRFYTEDPLGFRAGINFYAYVDNNPINARDPSGLFILELLGEIAGAIFGESSNSQVADMMEAEWDFDHFQENQEAIRRQYYNRDTSAHNLQLTEYGELDTGYRGFIEQGQLYAEDSAQYLAHQAVEADNPVSSALYNAGSLFASLYTRETASTTVDTLAGISAVRAFVVLTRENTVSSATDINWIKDKVFRWGAEGDATFNINKVPTSSAHFHLGPSKELMKYHLPMQGKDYLYTARSMINRLFK